MKKVILSGGGTGGHIYPAVAVAEALKRKWGDEVELLFVGAERKMEMEKIPALGYRIVGLPIAGLQRRLDWHNLAVPFKMMKSVSKARRTIRDFGADVAVGFGGYASAPVLWAAQRMGVPTVIQEQNSYAGMTNKILAKGAQRICVAYDGMERFFPAERIVKTGNPVRKNIVSLQLSREDAKRRLGFNPNRPLVVVVGGSLGARTINDAMKKAVEPLLEKGASILWQTGRLYADECSAATSHIADENLKVMPFVADMDLAYCAADLMVSRAGASTISEIQLTGVPAVLVPSPNVAEDHQRKNAEALSSRGAAVMIPDAECADRLAAEVASLLHNPEALKSLGDNARKMALRDADEKIVDNIEAILNR